MHDASPLLDPLAGPGGPVSVLRSADWDRIRSWSDSVYMPYRVRPTGRLLRPSSTMYATRIGAITLTRFCYGIPVTVDDLSADAGNILVLTQIRGRARHRAAGGEVDVGTGGTFLVDCSRIGHRVDFDGPHLQLNLTVPHRLVADLAERWYGLVPDDRLWQHKCTIGEPGSGWGNLLAYAVRSVAAAPDRVATGRVGQHLQDMLVGHLLIEWAARAGVPLDGGETAAAPGYVRRAEAYMRDRLQELPTVPEVAAAAGVSVRALSGGFRRYRGTTVQRFMRELRLQRIRADLSAAAPGETVSAVAARWGYVNLGVFAASYRNRFGENPSQTLGRVRR